MSNRVVAIISVLKPVDDTRNYEKIAVSLGNTNKYDINIIGFWTKKIPSAANITFYPIFNFQRNRPERILSPLKIWHLLIKLKPELIIVTCAELLAVTCIYKILFGAKVIYDVQENYYWNFLHSGAYQKILKYPLALLSRITEHIVAPLIDAFFLAEKVYEEQLSFVKKQFLILENKAIIPAWIEKLYQKPTLKKRFLYCGTISRHFGIFEAINFFKSLSIHLPESELVIAGFAPDHGIFHELLTLTETNHSIKIIGGDTLLTHDEILTEMLCADFVLMPYQSGKSLDGRIPTKLYECLCLEIPIIISVNPAWNELVTENNAGIIHDFKTGDTSSIVQKLSGNFYGKGLSNNYLWTANEALFLETIDSLFKVRRV